MSSDCAKLDFKDADVLLGKCNSISKGSLQLSVDGLEEAAESDGDDTGNIGNVGNAPESDGDGTCYIVDVVDASESNRYGTSNTGAGDSSESDGDDTGNTGNMGSEELQANMTGICSRDALQTSDFSPRSSDEGEEGSETSETTPGTPAALISAMKGGREKNGLSSGKLTVSWAPDVYDPPPSIVSHTRNKKQQKSKGKDKENHKKNGKKGQKGGNSSRGGKDKKQSPKNGRSADAYCGGGGFFKTNLTKVHFSVPEAV